MRLIQFNIQLFAHKKGQSSTSNGRDSAGRRLGAKASDRERMQKCVNCCCVFRLIIFVRLCMTHPWHSTVFLKIAW